MTIKAHGDGFGSGLIGFDIARLNGHPPLRAAHRPLCCGLVLLQEIHMNSVFQLRGVVAACFFASVAATATATEAPAPAVEPAGSVLIKIERAVERGAKAAASGIERGAKAAEHGVKVGVRAAARGIETGAKAVARVADSVAEKVRP